VIVPRHWAEARVQHREPGRQVTVRRFGWSDASQADAQRMADERARDALARILAGEKLPRREHKVPYNGAEGLPIREEVLAVHGTSVITRNAYGAACLNTPDVLFADVDVLTQSFYWRILAVFALLAIGLCVYFRVGASWYCLGSMGLLLLTIFVEKLVLRVHARFAPSLEVGTLRRLRRFVKRHPDFRVRVYRTPAGLRLLAMHRPFDPAEPEVAAFFRAVRADPEYVSMCLRQRCFRARLTPKPWRIGIGEHMKPRPGVWPVNPQRLPDRQRWVRDYERAAREFAACRYVDTLGSGSVDPHAEDVRKLHDELSRAADDLPIA
jgi:hypothetical protein